MPIPSIMRYLLFILFLPLTLQAQTEHTVRPNSADPLSGTPNNFHYAYINQTLNQKNKLFLFFPGTGALPYFYQEILKHAANLGYHAIGLTYPNKEAINQICLTTTDTTCHSKARLEVFDGIDRHPDLSIDENNCIERRTLKLLQYLQLNFPSENWGQYYIDNQILWDKIMVSGHSQGGGHAGIISKIKQVDRVVMFAAMDWITLLNRNADWITWNGATPNDRYYGFSHHNDESVNFNKIQTTWDNYGMKEFGNLALVDSLSSPYNGSHKLYTLLTPANDPSKFHGSVVADSYTPFSSNVPVYAPVWTYMMEGDNVLSANEAVKNIEKCSVYPNPARSHINIHCSNGLGPYYSIFNIQGKKLRIGVVDDKAIDLSDLSRGIYILNIQGDTFVNTVKILKE